MLALRPLVRNRRARRGMVSTETLLVLPLFLTVVLGMVGLADLLIAEQLLNEASARGARVAAVGGSDEQIKDAIQAILGPDKMANATIYVGRPHRANQSESHGHDGQWQQNAENQQGRPIWPGELIEVRIEIQAQNATTTSLIHFCPNQQLIGRTVMQLECPRYAKTDCQNH